MLHYLIILLILSIDVSGLPWLSLKEPQNEMALQQNGDGQTGVLEDLKTLLETYYGKTDEPSKLLDEGKNEQNVYESDEVSPDSSEDMTYNPFRECLVKYFSDVEQFITCARQVVVERSIQDNEIEFSKRRQGMLKLNASGWKRKKRDTSSMLARQTLRDTSSMFPRATRGQQEYRLNRLLNQLLMRKRQKLRFNPSGW